MAFFIFSKFDLETQTAMFWFLFTKFLFIKFQIYNKTLTEKYF